MKWIILILLVTSISVGHVLASETVSETERIETAVEQYCYGLDSSNEGIRNSILCQLAKIKLVYPETDLKCVGQKISQLALNDQSAIVRINASITKAILMEELNNIQVNINTYIPHEFFSQLYIIASTPQ